MIFRGSFSAVSTPIFANRLFATQEGFGEGADTKKEDYFNNPHPHPYRHPKAIIGCTDSHASGTNGRSSWAKARWGRSRQDPWIPLDGFTARTRHPYLRAESTTTPDFVQKFQKTTLRKAFGIGDVWNTPCRAEKGSVSKFLLENC